jgi:hypothetical protein
VCFQCRLFYEEDYYLFAAFLHAMLFSSTRGFLLYLNRHEDGSAYKDMRIRKEKKKKKKKKD